MNYLIAVDLEGIHGTTTVRGVSFGIKSGNTEAIKAAKNAEIEINTVAKALFDNGADEVYFWDNHGNGDNINKENLDKRLKFVYHGYYKRMEFLDTVKIDKMIMLGYHTMAGTNALLSHTYSGGDVQYMKIDGKPWGEFDFDTEVGYTYGIPTILFCADDACIAQFRRKNKYAKTVISKYALNNRYEANLRDEKEFLEDLYNSTVEAMQMKCKFKPYKFPAKMELRLTLALKGAYFKDKLLNDRGIDAKYGDDVFSLHYKVKDVQEALSIFFAKKKEE